jgi:myo-inositol 2-dehydrogenase/D-chiro-inositol 1-dehydrogenase
MDKVRIGSVGLGRLGLRHAQNIASKVSNATLEAICDVSADALAATKSELSVPKTYTRFEDMVADKNIDAVVIVSPSGMHTKHIALALDAGKHVFCEKPLGTTVAECREAEKAVNTHPDKVFMLGFMRRFDASYKYAHDKVVAGEIGRPVLFRSYGQDPERFIDGAIKFGPTSGGEFIDMCVHDIDLARWFTGSEPCSVYAIGGCYAHPEFAKWNDGDNVSALMKFKNDAMVFLFAGRTSPFGYNVQTEIIGTKGILRIGAVPQKNLVEVLDEHGVRKECSENFLERFEESYVTEMQEFVNCVTEGRKPEVTVEDGTRCTEIAFTCKRAFETGELVRF